MSDNSFGRNVTVTVFTATHNRSKQLYILYQSLCDQTVADFEWIIVNDASEDDTEQVIEDINKESKIKIFTYIKNEKNMGMCRSMDEAVKIARGKLFFKVDDDDRLREDAIEKVIEYEKQIANDFGFAGVSGLKCDFEGNAIGHEWDHESDYIDATDFERYKYKLDGDKAEAYYVDVLKKYGPHPYVKDESYSEFNGILWNRIAHSGLKVRWFNEKIYYCEYLSEGSTSNWFRNCRKNFVAYSIYVDEYKRYDELSLVMRIKILSKYFAVGFSKKYYAKKDYPTVLAWDKAWMPISYILGFGIYILRLIFKRKKYLVKS